MAGKFESDFRLLSDKFPKLNKFFWSEEGKSWVIDGELDICDAAGDYWDTFNIRIVVPRGYPYAVPLVFEMGDKIPREDDRHISEKGECCLDIGHRLLNMSRKGIRLTDFVTDKVYPYFANQIYFESEESYSSGEYAHHFGGVKQFYIEDMNITTATEAVMILEHIVSGKELGRNATCFCGRGKYKWCHLDVVTFLKSVGRKQLILDLAGFNEELKKTTP